MKNSGKKRKDADLLSRAWFWVVCFALAVVVTVLVFFLIRHIIKNRPEAPVVPTYMTQMQLNPIEDAPTAVESGLVVKEQCTYSGFFMEDGTDQYVENVMAIVVQNQSGRDLQLARIYAEFSDFTAVFHLTNLPAGESAMILEQNAHKAVTEKSTSIRMEDVTFFSEKMSLQTDIFEYVLGDGTLDVTNKSGKDIEGDIYVYYKNYKDNLYRGGITYRIKLEGGLKAGATKQLQPSHFYPDLSRLMTIQYIG